MSIACLSKWARLLSVLVTLCSLYSVRSSDIARSWGEPSCGVMLSILAETNVVRRGEPLRLNAQIKNLTTNAAFIFRSGKLSHDYDLLLILPQHQTNNVSPRSDQRPVSISFGSLHLSIAPGQTHSNDFGTILDSRLPSGRYQLFARREFISAGQTNCNRLTSNTIEFEIR